MCKLIDKGLFKTLKARTTKSEKSEKQRET